MSLISRIRRQTAVLWAHGPEGTDEHGHVRFQDPVQITCRWETETKEIIGRAGDTIVAKMVVYVDRLLTEGDVLMLGTLASITATNPKENPGAWEVIGVTAIPNLRNRETLYIAYL